MGARLASYCLESAMDNFHQEYVAQFTDPRLRFKFKSSSPRYKFGIWSDAFTQQSETGHPPNSRGNKVNIKSSATPGLKHLILKPAVVKSVKDLTENGNEIQNFDCPWESMHALNVNEASDGDENEQTSLENFNPTQEPSFTVIKSSSGLEMSGPTPNASPIANATKSKLTMTRSRPVLEIPQDADVSTGDASALAVGDCNVDEEKNKDQDDQNMSVLLSEQYQQF